MHRRVSQQKIYWLFWGVTFLLHIPPKRIFYNHIPSKHEAWVETQIYKALKAGAIKEVSPDFPHAISPLQVHEKTDGKLRLCFDGRYINLFMNPPTFSNEGPQTIPNWGWKGMWMFSLDHKSGYYHVPLNQYSWKFWHSPEASRFHDTVYGNWRRRTFKGSDSTL